MGDMTTNTDQSADPRHHPDERPGTVLVTCATGKNGRRIVGALRERGVPVRAASRRSAVPADRSDWHDDTPWAAALDSVSTMFLIHQPDFAVPGAADQVRALARRAAAVGVDRAVLLSGRGEPGAADAAQALFEELPRSTVLRCAWFDQNFTEGILRDAVLAGVFA